MENFKSFDLEIVDFHYLFTRILETNESAAECFLNMEMIWDMVNAGITDIAGQNFLKRKHNN